MELCLASLHPRILSGQIDSLAGLGRALTRRGHHISLVAPFDTTGLLDRSLLSLDTGPHKLSGAAMKMLQAIPRVVAGANVADLLHLALPTPAFGWIGDIVQASTSVPVVVSYEGHLAPGGQLLKPRRLRRSWRTYLPLWAINNGLFGRMTRFAGAHYVVSSAYQYDELLALGGPADRVSVLSNVIERDKLTRCAPERARAELGIPQGRSVVGYIGHFNDVKGVDVLAAAFARLVEQDEDAHLALAWSGQGNPEPVRGPLAQLEDHVTWLGKVHVGTFLCAVDLLALPYRCTAGQGAFPSLVMEALEAGCPLVTTRLPLLEEMLEDEVTALLCPPDRPDLLTAQMARLLSDGGLRQRVRTAQRVAARTRFAPDALAAQYEALYASLVTADARVARVAAAA